MDKIDTPVKVACVFIFILTTLPTCKKQAINETENALEQRLDRLMSEMSMQEKIEQLYYLTDGNDRLGIPQFKGSDGPHGIGNGAHGFSSFPVTIGMAATWDPMLIMRVGRAISLEQASRGKNRLAGPTLDLLIDPRIGRAPETIGEDPYLGGRISEAFVQGQNTTSVFGSVKHYNLNTYELNRRTNNYLSDNRSLVEFWGYHWKRTIQLGGAMSIMCAYNWVNGDKCAENKYLIKDLLRDHWGFNYYTMCDWGGFGNTGKALNSELDFCEGNDLYIKELPQGVANGTYDSTLVNRATRNVLRTKILSGMIDGVPVISKRVIDSKAHRELVYESGLKGLVLLKNDEKVLPLDREKIKSVALIGPNAAVLPLDGNSSSKVAPSYTIPVYEALNTLLGNERVNYAKGCNINDTDSSQFKKAIEISKKSDYVIFIGGLDHTIEGEGYFIDKEGDEKGGGIITRPDRPSGTVLLPGMQNALIKEIAKVNSNVILVVISGGICSVTPVIHDIKALLYGFYPGQEAGRAIVDVLFGTYNPSGKLPATMPKNDAQIIPIRPDFRNMVSTGVGYKWYDSQNFIPEFAFGSGLSYTDFEYSDISLENENPKAGDVVTVKFNLTNVGRIAGEEVAQLYLSTDSIFPNIEMPSKQLRGFKKIYLNAGETKTVTFNLTPEDMYIYDDVSRSYKVPEGEFMVQIGSASDQLKLKAPFTVLQSEFKHDLYPANIRTMPVFPKEGDKVVFMASLINNGTVETDFGDDHIVHFYVDDQKVATYYSKSISIPVGGMTMVVAEGIKASDWTASKGQYRITAKIESEKDADLNTDNNSCEGIINIPDGKVIPIDIYDYLNTLKASL
ncbi:glycoside hydrolase family 3 C-terminal domain-containing protein [Aestuariivivens sediminis]|uniref:glycoside hydrolase family 3 C-terminal domain-containing protein n=1 Tax=Aestuariivivens sediminis TaxID=2913557 RepID=UPI001F59B40E|nr:glycoside hydrolase family 3 C-terminal domain-containing protein [Aestuariivivens sediminis]